MKLNLGCGDNLVEGFLNIDKFDDAADMKMDMADVDFDDESVDEIVIYQALEHVPWHQTDKILTNCFRMLRKGGKLTVEVPDIGYVAQKICEEGISQKWHDNIYGGYHRPWDRLRYKDAEFHQGSIHYQGFDWTKLRNALLFAGFEDVVKNPMEKKHPDYQYEENLSVTATK